MSNIKGQKSILLRKTALFLAFTIFFQTAFPPVASALTGGPSQPEVSGFQPIGTSNMVDLFSGDFNYNIPLLDVDGYPINLGYQAGPMMDQEASWVGLGWSLNPGVINRNMRGIPDDFKGDKVKKEMNIRKDLTVGLEIGASFEALGFDVKKFPVLKGVGAKAGVFYNNRRKFGFEVSSSAAFSISKTMQKNTSLEGNLGLNLNFNSQTGIGVPGVSASLGLTQNIDDKQSEKKDIDPIDSAKGNKVLNDKNFLTSGTNKESSITASASLSSFSNFNSFPQSPMEMRNQSFAYNGKLTGEVFGLAPGTQIGGYVSEQRLEKNFDERATYGYLHLQNSINDPRSVQDYNKEKVAPYHKDKPILPVSYGTFDLFSVSGQGVSGQFRAMRNDIGIFRDPGLTNKSFSASGGLEPGAGNLFKIGGNLAVGGSTSKVKKWVDRNNLSNKIDFTQQKGIYENVFFKGSGQKIITDKAYFNDLKGEFPMRSELEFVNALSGIGVKSDFLFEKDDIILGTTESVSGFRRGVTQREKRGQLFSFLTEEEKKAGLSLGPIQSESEMRKDHHISEISILQEDGSRYIYGIAAYNKMKKDVTFNREKISSEEDVKGGTRNNNELIQYEPGVDNSISNRQGQDYYFDSEEVPGYAHSYLLTHVLSADYVDVTGDGVSDDDLGSIVKLNYLQKFGKDGDNYYNWRIPFGKNKAQYAEGYKSKTDDDKASYVYGQKEIWYLDNIESRTMIAKFHTSDRLDAVGVHDENGGEIDPRLAIGRMQKLDRIDLFSKAEFINNSSPVPIKTVHFTYANSDEVDMHLCKNVPNNLKPGEGKLTLKSVYFTYQNSNRGMLNAYNFNYENLNPNYNLQAVDRWGCYREVDESITYSGNPNYPDQLPEPNEFPYVLQEHQQSSEEENLHTNTDNFVAAWNLSSIELPSGSTINVKYESDDYAYVQDHRAGQMMFISGFTKSKPIENKPINWNELLFDSEKDPKNYMVIDLPQKISNSLTNEQAISILKKKYFEDVDKIYFKVAVNLTGEQNEIDKYEYITGYMNFNLDDVDFIPDSNREKISIKVKTIKIRQQEYHPITIATLQTIRLNFPEITYPGVGPSDNLKNSGLIKSLIGYVAQIGRAVNGFNKSSINKGWGQTIDLNKSWIRLANPDFKKQGGGSRVKEINITDGWNQGNDTESTYGQKYIYTTNLELPNGEQIEISSGVATYEPLQGNEENLLRKPMPSYKERVLLGPDNSYFVEKPIGESLYPMASVGYSDVRVESFGSYKDMTKKGVGYSVNQFFTAKDFPVKVKFSPINNDKRLPNIGKFISLPLQKDKLGVSQGFSVEVNDMHGKPSFEAVYDGGNNKVSSTKYEYRTEKDDNNDPINELSNFVSAINPDGFVSDDYLLGVEMDIWQEMQQDEIKTKDIGISANSDGFLASIVPVVLPVILPSYVDYENEFSSSTTTKLIKRFGLIEKVTVEENGSSIHTINRLYDSETGEVLLTETQNEFDKPVYSFKYPAHWAYDGMGLAYQNIGVIIDAKIENGQLTQNVDNSVVNLLVPGDELLVFVQENNTVTDVLNKHIVSESLVNSSELCLQDVQGSVLMDGTYKAKVLRSGRRNQASAPIATVSTLQDPTPSNGQSISITNAHEILNASAVEYDDYWQMQCARESADNGENVLLPINELQNFYAKGLKGNWRPKRSYVYHTDRSGASLPLRNIDIKKDGVFENFNAFWGITAQNKWQPNTTDDRWVKANTIEIYDIRGNELENIDAIGNYSSAQFGYDDTRATAIASNAQKCEINFDSFEDYYFENNPINLLASISNRFTFVQDPSRGNLSSELAHTGRYSLKIPPSSSLEEASKLKPLTNICGGDPCLDDLIPPTIVGVPEDVTVTCGSVPEMPSNITASDNCDANTTIDFIEITHNGLCENSQVIIREWSATDLSGNSIQSKQVITILDNVPPIVFGPEDITIVCGDQYPSEDFTAIDNCDPELEIEFNENFSDDCNCPENLTRNWIAVDNCGNSQVFVQVITIDNPTNQACDECEEDMQPPAFSGVPDDITVSCSSIGEMPTNVIATDNCDGPVDVAYEQVSIDGDCTGSRKIVNVWTSLDEAGNFAEAVQEITVEDTNSPILLNVPLNTTIICEDLSIEVFDVSVIDFCDPNVIVTFEEIMSNTCACPDQVTRTWTSIDDCGNSVIASQIIIVENPTNIGCGGDDCEADIVPPVLVGIPADVTYDCSGFPEHTNNISATDNCDTNVSIDLVEEIVEGDCPESYTIVKTWTAIDESGNFSVGIQQITIQDILSPFFVNLPEDITVACDEIPSADPELIVLDNCDPDPFILFSELTSPSSPDICNEPFIITRLWDIGDACGNFVSGFQTITVNDNTFNRNVVENIALLQNVDEDVFRTKTTSVEAQIASVSPVTCRSKGEVILTPDSYKYTWSDGGTGPVRNDLSAGRYKVNYKDSNGVNEVIKIQVLDDCDSSTDENNPLNKSTGGDSTTSLCEQCLPTLHLSPGKEYFFNVWAATLRTSKFGGSPDMAELEIQFKNNKELLGEETILSQPYGPIVEGWQRISGSFVVPSNATSFTIRLNNNSVGEALFFDDFRVHPVNSNMVSYVYDPFSLRLWATLDDNNYASFYEYDDEGILVRTKRETEKGIVTIQEARTILSPNNEQ